MLENRQLVHEIRSLLEVLYKRDVLKNFLKFIDKTKKQSSGILPKDVKISKFIEKNFFFGNFFFNKVAHWKPETARNNHWRWSSKFGNFNGVFFNKVAFLRDYNFIKKSFKTNRFL